MLSCVATATRAWTVRVQGLDIGSTSETHSLDLVGSDGERPETDQLISWKIGHMLRSSRFFEMGRESAQRYSAPRPNFEGGGSRNEVLGPSKEFPAPFF